jgi:hypothetical protein
VSRPALLASVAWPARWSGEFRWWHRIDELRAFGLRWSEIEADAFARPVSWEDA